MSLNLLRESLQQLPYAMRERIIGYARSVRDSLPEIFREADVQYNLEVADQVVFLAGVKKLYSLCSSAYWTTDNCLEELSKEKIYSFQIGGSLYTRDSKLHRRLGQLLSEFEQFLSKEKLEQLPKTSYVEIVRECSDGH